MPLICQMKTSYLHHMQYEHALGIQVQRPWKVKAAILLNLFVFLPWSLAKKYTSPAIKQPYILPWALTFELCRSCMENYVSHCAYLFIYFILTQRCIILIQRSLVAPAIPVVSLTSNVYTIIFSRNITIKIHTSRVWLWFSQIYMLCPPNLPPFPCLLLFNYNKHVSNVIRLCKLSCFQIRKTVVQTLESGVFLSIILRWNVKFVLYSK